MLKTMRAHTPTRFIYRIIFSACVGLVVFIAFPSVSFAASTLVWNNVTEDPDTGEILSGTEMHMQNGGAYQVPLHIAKDAWVLTDPPLEFGSFPEGVLFFIPDPSLPARQFVSNVGGFFDPRQLSWEQPGTYELDVYASPPIFLIQNTKWTDKLLALVIGPTAHAAATDIFIETIRFTITEESVTSACCSSVLFLPGIKGSVLNINSDTVWPPTFWSDDLSQLALTISGDSVNPVVVDGVLETFYLTPIYSGFTAFMDDLVASGTTTEWRALPYDWRFSPEKILADGIQTPAGTVDPIEETETLASNSETGKVIIVAHSMGGLLGKAIIKKLQDNGKENLIDSFVMIGTPQLGTPQAAASLLHGGGEDIGAGFIVDASMARRVAQNFRSTYDLLPSPRYFDEVTEPIIVFDPNASFTQEWRDYWGPAIDSYAEFFSFITGDGVTRLDPEFTKLQIPEILRTDLTERARDFHNVYDTYTFPDSIRVVQVAGWGMPTVKAIKYEKRHFMQNYKTLFTREGDSTVVYPSAISSVADETYFFNLTTYNALEDIPDYKHRDLLSSSPIQQVLASVIKKEDISQTQYIVSNKPIPGSLTDQLIVSTHSPVILGAYDQGGRFSGISPSQDLGADVLLVTEDIPGSTFMSFGDSQYLFLPNEVAYTVVFSGTGSGPTDVEIENFANDTPTLVAIYSNIPVTASTSATFVVNSASPQDARISVDSNNDGQVDTYIAPDNQSLTLNELLTNLKTVVQNLAVKDKLKTNLLKKIKNIEKKIAKQKNKKVSKAVMNFEKQIIKKGKRNKLSDTDVAEIVRLLEKIENAL